MKLFFLMLALSFSAFGQVRLSDKYFRGAVSECNGYLHPVEATDLEAAQVLSCVEKKLKEKNRYDELKETVLFWNPLQTMKDNENRAKCRHHIGKRNFHGEDSGAYEACIKSLNCVNPKPWIDHVGLSEAPCVSPNEIGVGQDGKVVSGDRAGAEEKTKASSESKKASAGATRK